MNYATRAHVALSLDADIKHRLQAAGIAVLASFALIASPMPAHAKGGGHGGGGHSSSSHSSHSSHSHSSSRPSYPRSSTLSSRSGRSGSSRRSSSSRRSRSSQSYSSAYSSERNTRIYPTKDEARENGGMICPASLPKAGTKVDIVGVGTATVLQSQPALQTGLYGGSADSKPLPAGFDGGCTLQVQYADGTTDTVSAAEVPSPAWLDFVEVAIPVTYFGGGALLDIMPSSTKYDDFRERYDAWLAAEDDGAPDTLVAPRGLHAELSGEYWGASDESDEGDQAVRTHLRFAADGTVTGRGRDDVDGSYRVQGGRWVMAPDGNVQLAWKEVYDEGFDAICIGEYNAATGAIEARFESSRNVGGSFKLKKKPSIF